MDFFFLTKGRAYSFYALSRTTKFHRTGRLTKEIVISNKIKSSTFFCNWDLVHVDLNTQVNKLFRKSIKKIRPNRTSKSKVMLGQSSVQKSHCFPPIPEIQCFLALEYIALARQNFSLRHSSAFKIQRNYVYVVYPTQARFRLQKMQPLFSSLKP